MANLTLRELKNAAAKNMYATFEKEMKQKPLYCITNEEIEIDSEGMAAIYRISRYDAFLVVVDVDNRSWMEVCEHLDEAQKVATDMLYGKLMLLSE
jgi:aminopeptidase-like protein